MDEESLLSTTAERKIAGDTIRKKAYSWLQIQNWGHSGIPCEPLRAEVSLQTSAIYAAQSEDGV